MRREIFGGAVLVVVFGGLLLGGAALAQDRQAVVKPAPPATRWQSPPDLRPGEMVIKRVGTRKVVVAPTVPELPYEGPGPRIVTIGYMVRDASEIGWGPQIHEAAPLYTGYGYEYGRYGYGSSCGYYGYNSYLPSYRSYGSSCGFGYGGGGFSFGTPSYRVSSAPARAVRFR